MPNILLIDDDEATRYAMAKMLRARGHVVTIAEDSLEGLRHIDDAPPFDLLLVDIVMPRGRPHGVALARMLRQRDYPAPVIFITAYLDLAKEELDLPWVLLQKPIEEAALMRAIEDALAPPKLKA